MEILQFFETEEEAKREIKTALVLELVRRRKVSNDVSYECPIE
jgi:hypothetical protein